jgi:hypothetical protein
MINGGNNYNLLIYDVRNNYFSKELNADRNGTVIIRILENDRE